MTFNEYTIQRKRGAKETLLSILLYLAATLLSAALFIIFMRFAQITLLVCFGLFYLAHRLSSKMNKEYEYIFTQDNVCIDVILNKARRKRLLSFDLADVEIIASVNDVNYKNELTRDYDRVIDATSGSQNANVYFAAISAETRILLKFEPTHSALKELFKYAPSKIKITD